MKKIFITAIALLLVFQASADISAVLSEIKGKVEVKAQGGSWAAAVEGMPVDTLTTISTGFDSSVVLKMNKTTVFVKPLTRMTLDKLVESNGTVSTSLFLRVGSVKASVKSTEGVKQDFKVQSPYSTASVRGTEWDYDGFRVDTTEGIVALQPVTPTRDVGGADVTGDFIGAPTVAQSEPVAVPAGQGGAVVVPVGFTPISQGVVHGETALVASSSLPPTPGAAAVSNQPVAKNGSVTITWIKGN
jgi:hypothetical protein